MANLIFLVLISAILVVSSIFLAARRMKTKYRQSNFVISRFAFATSSVLYSQLTVVALIVISFGILAMFLPSFYVAMFMPLSSGSGLPIATISFIISFIIYPFIQKAVSRNSSADSLVTLPLNNSVPKKIIDNLHKYTLFIFIIPVFLFIMSSPFYKLLERLTIVTNNVNLIRFQPLESHRDILYAKIALNKQESSICKNIKSPYGRNDCYEATDPEFIRYSTTCELYTKAGDLIVADSTQFDCVLGRLEEQKKTDKLIDCDAIAATYEKNTQIWGLVFTCHSLSIEQKAILLNLPSSCDETLSPERQQKSGSYDMAIIYGQCLANFPESPELKGYCEGSYTKNDYFLRQIGCKNI